MLGVAEHSLFASGTGQVAGVEGGDRGWPVDDRYWLVVGEAVCDGDELAGEVGPVEPGLGDEQFGGGFEAVDALGMGA
jgi:hypothetical protein